MTWDRSRRAVPVWLWRPPLCNHLHRGGYFLHSLPEGSRPCARGATRRKAGARPGSGGGATSSRLRAPGPINSRESKDRGNGHSRDVQGVPRGRRVFGRRPERRPPRVRRRGPPARRHASRAGPRCPAIDRSGHPGRRRPRIDHSPGRVPGRRRPGRRVPPGRPRLLQPRTARDEFHPPAPVWRGSGRDRGPRRRARGGEVEIKRVGEKLVVARYGGATWVHCAQVVPRTPGASVYDGATCRSSARSDRSSAASGSASIR